MPAPSGIKCEIEFTAGVWTDVTTDLDWNTGWTIRVGRTAPQQQPQAGTLSLQLRNPLGKYTPGLAVLSDGSAAPYYPNVTRRKRIRVSNSSGVRFLGFIKSWSPVRVNGVAAYCQIQAADRMDLLSRVVMAQGIDAEILLDQPVAYWPLTDPVGSTTAVDASGVNTIPLGISGFGSTAPVFGQPSPDGSTTAVEFVGPSGKFLQASFPASGGTSLTFEVFVNAGLAVPSNEVLFSVGSFSVSAQATLPFLFGFDGLAAFNAGSINDGLWHHILVVVTGGTMSLYLDGTLAGSMATSQPTSVSNAAAGGIFGGSFAPGTFTERAFAIYDHVLSAARILAHANVAQQANELVSDKVQRFLTYAGLTSADWNVDTSTVLTGTYAQSGRDILSACQDMSITEGGGSVTYVQGGTVQFRNRAFRKAAAPTLTIDAEYDLDNTNYQPSLDDSNLINSVTVSRSDSDTTLSTQTATNIASINAEYLSSQQVTSYAATDSDALNMAQDIVASGAFAAIRLPQVAVDLLTAKNNLYASVQATGIGNRIRLTNLPSTALPATQIDVLAEGWTETANIRQYQLVYDTSPADAPAKMILDDTTYGRLQAQSNCALNASLTNAATTVVIKSPTGPTFTSVGARYPLKIVVDAEIITLNSAPGGSSSPQTFTGCTRGVNGTTAAAHASNATVALYPTSTLAL